MLGSELRSRGNELESNELEALGLKATDDLTNKTTLIQSQNQIKNKEERNLKRKARRT